MHPGSAADVRILEYSGLDTSKLTARYQRVRDALERNDFRAAEVKKLVNLKHGKFYRAKLDDANRLLFSLVRCGGETCALMLEVIEHHAYEKSRFLRGASIDESKIPLLDAAPAPEEAQMLRYLHPMRSAIQYLDKPLSFDDVQEAVYRSPAPLVLVGGAGSGKTALTLEKMKAADGQVLYVTMSAFLAQGARDLYYAQGFDRDDQEAVFLSYREFLESLRVPPGREVAWRDYAGWFERQRQGFKGVDAHQAWEEMRGVIAADAGGVMSREVYLGLGIRQSVFGEAERARVYDLFERYRKWLPEVGLYDPGLVAQHWLALAAPRYDFVVVDEVQDLTPAQLLLVLRMLKSPDGFLLCGDSNQIVHPNFFAWNRVKTLFWRDAELAARQPLHVLRANFRNGRLVTQVANRLLKIKHRRFGSIDRESNFLVEATGADEGLVTLLRDDEAVRRRLDEQTRRAASCAVLVLREEDKAQARQHFRTPLVFAIHEAKGLEYEHIVLYRFVSDRRAEYAEVAAGVDADHLDGDGLEYRRARDKTDKSLEIYKFYVNALYVALTRAIRSVYLVESDVAHPLVQLLGLSVQAQDVQVAAQQSSREDWQREARRLELQGKQEQAEAVRSQLLGETPVPWPVFDEPRVRDALGKVFRERIPGGKLRQQLLEYAASVDEPMLAAWLDYERLSAPQRAESVAIGMLPEARGFEALRATLGRKHLATFGARNFKDILRQCDQHGIEFRTTMNLTPLMAAAAAGNVALTEALLDRGADPLAMDHRGHGPLHWAMREAVRDAVYARGPFASIYERVAPGAIDLRIDDRLVRLERRSSEYLVFQTFWALHGRSFASAARSGGHGAFDTRALLAAWSNFPALVLRPERNRRAFLSGVLARSEASSDYAWSRRLFLRAAHGRYQINPRLALRGRRGSDEVWQPALVALNQPLVHELAHPFNWETSDACWRFAGGEPLQAPVAAQDWPARERAQLESWRLEAAAEAQQRRQWLDPQRREANAGTRAAPGRALRRVPRSPMGATPPASSPVTPPAAVPPPTTAPGTATTLATGQAESPATAGPPLREVPKWGTRAAKQAALDALRQQQIAARAKKDGAGGDGS